MAHTRAVSKTVQGWMHPAEKLIHAVLILCTAGFWTPVYWSRKRSVKRTATTYEIGGQ